MSDDLVRWFRLYALLSAVPMTVIGVILSQEGNPLGALMVALHFLMLVPIAYEYAEELYG